MYLKLFRTVMVRVPDPLHPGKRAFEEREIDAGAEGASFEGQSFSADDGWVDFSPEAFAHFRGLRYPDGARWRTPEEVGEQVLAGASASTSVEEALPPVRAARRKAAAD